MKMVFILSMNSISYHKIFNVWSLNLETKNVTSPNPKGRRDQQLKKK